MTLDKAVTACVALAALLLCAESRGQTAPAEAAELSPEPASQQAARMGAVLDGQLSHARWWYYGWTSGYAAISITETVLNATASGDAQTAARVGIVISTAGFL